MANHVIVGEIAAAFGVKGWVKIHSFTDPPGNILDYSPWLVVGKDGSKEYKVITGRKHGTNVVAQLEGIDDRDQAISLRSCKIFVSREMFPPAPPGQYYWADLIGLRVTNLESEDFGTVMEIMATGANDVIVVNGDRERLIPFVIGQYIKEINLEDGSMLVDWDSDF